MDKTIRGILETLQKNSLRSTRSLKEECDFALKEIKQYLEGRKKNLGSNVYGEAYDEALTELMEELK